MLPTLIGRPIVVAVIVRCLVWANIKFNMARPISQLFAYHCFPEERSSPCPRITCDGQHFPQQRPGNIGLLQESQCSETLDRAQPLGRWGHRLTGSAQG
eukprot:7541059-Pyramimonas_sp.AAC.1